MISKIQSSCRYFRDVTVVLSFRARRVQKQLYVGSESAFDAPSPKLALSHERAGFAQTDFVLGCGKPYVRHCARLLLLKIV